MNVIQKSEAIKNGLRKGFQDGRSKMAKLTCYGYTINSDGESWRGQNSAPDIWTVSCWWQPWKNRVFFPLLAGPDGIGKPSANCSPMKNIPGECCSRKRSAPALSRSKTMASWNGISIPVPMRPLFLMRCSWQYGRRNSSEPKIPKTWLVWVSHCKTKTLSWVYTNVQLLYKYTCAIRDIFPTFQQKVNYDRRKLKLSY